MRANASDSRALVHLTELLKTHRDQVATEVPDIDELVDQCAEAVVAARNAYREIMDRQG